MTPPPIGEAVPAMGPLAGIRVLEVGQAASWGPRW
jgi:hypothetical protein